jgi:hypothetical protein
MQARRISNIHHSVQSLHHISRIEKQSGYFAQRPDHPNRRFPLGYIATLSHKSNKEEKKNENR